MARGRARVDRRALALAVCVAASSVARGRAAVDARAAASRWLDDAIARGGVDLIDGARVADERAGSDRLGLALTHAPVERMEAYARVRWNETLHPSRYDATAPGGLGSALASMRSEHGNDDKMALIVCLLYERYELGDRSAFAEYFRTMPGEFDTPTHWSDDTAKELRGSDTYEVDIVDEYKLLNTVWNALRVRVFDVYTDVFVGKAARSLYALRWAWTVAHARATRVSGKDGLALVPVIDMIRECGKDIDADKADIVDDEGFAVYDRHADEVVVYAKRDYAPGEELCERFGGWNNGESVQHLGYLPDVHTNSTRNCVLMVLTPEKKRNEEKVRKAGFDVPWRVCVPSAASESSLDMLSAYAELASGRAVEIGGDGVPKNVRRDGVRDVLLARLKRYPTSLEQDDAALSTMRDSMREFAAALERDDMQLLERERVREKLRDMRRSALAVELRVREKTILNALIDRVAPAADELVKDEL